MSLEAPGAVPLSQPQSDRFGPGGLPSAAVYRSLGNKLLAGGRVRGGVLASGDPPEGANMVDPGVGGLLGFELGLRLRPLGGDGPARATGLWIDLFAGGGLTGSDLEPMADLGVGYSFRAGGLDIGPLARYVFVRGGDGDLDDRSAHLALVGIEITLFDGRPAPPPPPPIVVAKPRPKPEPEPVDSDGDGVMDPDDSCPETPEDKDGVKDDDGCPEDNDGDGIADADDACPMEAEVVNGIDDEDGCPDKGLIVLKQDRIILEETVLFDSKRARVKRRARPVLRAIVTLWKQHPEWQKMVIEGHADVRGPDDYNKWLSGERAKRVRTALVGVGFDPDKVEAVGVGEERPRDNRDTEEAHQRNRRVEFVIIKTREETRGVRTDQSAAPGQPPAEPSDAPAPTPDFDAPGPDAPAPDAPAKDEEAP